MANLENDTLQIVLEQIKEDIIKTKKFKNDANLIDYIVNYVLDIEEQNRLMRSSINVFKDMLSENDHELKEYLEK